MADDYRAAIVELQQMRERVRTIRTLHCEPKSNTNPRYLALSNVVSNLTKTIDDMKADVWWADARRKTLVRYAIEFL